MKKAVVQWYGKKATIGICMEECGELVHALSKYSRASGEGFATDTNIEIANKELVKAIADAINAINSVAYILKINSKEVREHIARSDEEALARLE